MAQRVRKFIRYMAATDASPVGIIALEYLRSLLRIAPVRVVSMSGGTLEGPWDYYAAVLATPIGPSFVNVVCCAPVRWSFLHATHMPVMLEGKVVGSERAEQRIELYTQGVRNVLIMPQGPEGPHQAAVAAKFEARIVPTPQSEAERLRNCLGTLIPVPVSETNHVVLRSVVDPCP